ncbi:hypothetical protein NMG60_11035525 [Bertholletia excelsa]
MAVAGEDKKVWSLRKVPFWRSTSAGFSSSSSPSQRVPQQTHLHLVDQFHSQSNDNDYTLQNHPPTLFPPSPSPFFQLGAGSPLILPQNSSFPFQTTAPKSCYMRPPGGILSPGESLIATVFKFVEYPENNEKLVGQKSRVKFKIMSLKVKGDMEYVPELFDEQKDQVAVEKILRVVFLDPERPCPALDKLNRQLAEADAALEASKKPPEDTGPRIVGEGLVIDEWKERRERYLARQQVEGVDSI